MATSERRASLLIVDDEPLYTEVVGEVCSLNGFDVIIASTAQEGIEKALLHRPDVVLMDVMMPPVSGWEALRHLKSNPRTRQIPVVMITGHDIDAFGSEVLGTATSGFLMKPCPTELLIETLDRALGRSPGC